MAALLLCEKPMVRYEKQKPKSFDFFTEYLAERSYTRSDHAKRHIKNNYQTLDIRKDFADSLDELFKPLHKGSHPNYETIKSRVNTAAGDFFFSAGYDAARESQYQRQIEDRLIVSDFVLKTLVEIKTRLIASHNNEV